MEKGAPLSEVMAERAILDRRVEKINEIALFL
jgi:hypothetical protein